MSTRNEPKPVHTLDYGRADAGESHKDLETPGTGAGIHSRYERVEALEPEFVPKQASVPPWLSRYLAVASGRNISPALKQMLRDELWHARDPESGVLKDLLSQSRKAYRGEIGKTVGAAGAPIAVGAALYTALAGRDDKAKA